MGAWLRARKDIAAPLPACNPVERWLFVQILFRCHIHNYTSSVASFFGNNSWYACDAFANLALSSGSGQFFARPYLHSKIARLMLHNVVSVELRG